MFRDLRHKRADLDAVAAHGAWRCDRTPIPQHIPGLVRWATNYPREIAEAALAHTLKDKTEAAYQRGDMMEKRRGLMAEWATFCATPRRRRQTQPASHGNIDVPC